MNFFNKSKGKRKRDSSVISGFGKKKKRNSKTQRVLKNKAKKARLVLVRLILGITLIAGLALGGYYAVNFVLDIRSTATGTAQYRELENFNNIYAYPGSENIYKNVQNDQVKEFLASGKAVYRLPAKSNIDDVFEFYNDNLPTDNWRLVNSVPRGDDSQKFGQYWVKDNFAIRVHSVNNDIWYEKVTLEEAESGLAAEVQLEVERELLLSANDGTELLPSYPWKGTLDPAYILDYYSVGEDEVLGIYIRKSGSNEIINIHPLGKIENNNEDSLVIKYLDSLSREEESFVDGNWEIVSSSRGEISGKKAFIANISSDGLPGSINMYVLENPVNGYYYGISDFGTSGEDESYLPKLIESIEIND